MSGLQAKISCFKEVTAAITTHIAPLVEPVPLSMYPSLSLSPSPSPSTYTSTCASISKQTDLEEVRGVVEGVVEGVEVRIKGVEGEMREGIEEENGKEKDDAASTSASTSSCVLKLELNRNAIPLAKTHELYVALSNIRVDFSALQNQLARSFSYVNT
jgi:hypothetical protein